MSCHAMLSSQRSASAQLPIGSTRAVGRLSPSLRSAAACPVKEEAVRVASPAGHQARPMDHLKQRVGLGGCPAQAGAGGSPRAERAVRGGQFSGRASIW